MSLLGTLPELRRDSSYSTPRAFEVLVGKIWECAVMIPSLFLGSLGPPLGQVAPLGQAPDTPSLPWP